MGFFKLVIYTIWLLPAVFLAWYFYVSFNSPDGEHEIQSVFEMIYEGPPVRAPAIPEKYGFEKTVVHENLSQYSITHHIHTPSKPWPDNIKFPLVIHFHDKYLTTYSAIYATQPPILSQYPAIHLVPELPPGQNWGSITQPKHENHLQRIIQRLSSTYPIDSRRIYMIGCGSGSQGVLQALDNINIRFSAVVAHHAYWNGVNLPKPFLITPMIFIADQFNQDYSPAITRKFSNRVNENGGNTTFKMFKDVENDCQGKAFYSSAVWAWLFKQKLTKP